jgi:hypothetical protein
MYRRVHWIIGGVPLALLLAVAGTAAAFPTVRYIASGLWNVPDRLPALPENGRVHYEPGGGRLCA